MSGRYPHAAGPRDERAHVYVQDAIDKNYLDTGQKYILQGFRDHAAANEVRRSMAAALSHFGLGKASWVTDSDGAQCYQDCKDPDAPHGAGFELHSKNRARRHIVKQTGGDPSKLKYNPYAPRRQGRFDADGNWIDGT
jgi:hypothetical protein